MSVNKAYLSILLAISFANSAYAEWEKLPQKSGSGTWQKVTCEAGSGWRVCRETEVCYNRHNSNTYSYRYENDRFGTTNGWYFVINGVSHKVPASVWNGRVYVSGGYVYTRGLALERVTIPGNTYGKWDYTEVCVRPA